jgi:hypothetical protein
MISRNCFFKHFICLLGLLVLFITNISTAQINSETGLYKGRSIKYEVGRAILRTTSDSGFVALQPFINTHSVTVDWVWSVPQKLDSQMC